MAHTVEVDVTNAGELAKFLLTVPEGVRVATNIGYSMFAGWGDIKKVVYFVDDGVVELIFD